MSYATANDLLVWYGARELAQVAVPDDLTTAGPELMRLTINDADRDTFTEEEISAADAGLARINSALSDAEQLMNSYLALRYDIPLTGTLIQASALPRTCGAIARRLLHHAFVPEEVTMGYDMALLWLKEVAFGKAELDRDVTTTGAGSPAFETGERVFDQETLRGFV
ncbi:MAG: DUF1320 domain-containing protein [Magnetococcus sp. YQC-5]